MYDQFKKYKVKIRRGPGWEVKPDAELIDGKVFEFTNGWVMDEKDTSIYIGETAMLPHDDTWPYCEIGWLASGDLEEVAA